MQRVIATSGMEQAVQSNQPIELHGTSTGNCIRVAIALEDAGVPYRIIHVDLYGNEHHGAEYLQLNPAGRVPTIIDHSLDGEPLVLTQSNAILHHVAGKKPGTLWPVDDARAIAVAYERLLYFITDVIAPSHAAFFLPAAQTESRALLTHRSMESLIGAERFVSNSPFMAGASFTLADIAALTITQASVEDLDWSVLPNLKRWYAHVMARAGVQRGLRAFDQPEKRAT